MMFHVKERHLCAIVDSYSCSQMQELKQHKDKTSKYILIIRENTEGKYAHLEVIFYIIEIIFKKLRLDYY